MNNPKLYKITLKREDTNTPNEWQDYETAFHVSAPRLRTLFYKIGMQIENLTGKQSLKTKNCLKIEITVQK